MRGFMGMTGGGGGVITGEWLERDRREVRKRSELGCWSDREAGHVVESGMSE